MYATAGLASNYYQPTCPQLLLGVQSK